MTKYIIVGGVAGGATTAARLRRLDENADIIMFERGEYISYANCGLPYYIGDVITDRSQLLLQTPESFKARLNIDVRVLNEVVSIDSKNQRVSVKNLSTNETYTESYDKLILSPGAAPLVPPIPGINDNSIFTLRNVRDTDVIKNYCNEHKPKKAVIVGAGFIGLEMAENFHHLGMDVSVVEMANQVMAPIDFEMASIVHEHLRMKNTEIILEDGVKSFNRDGDNIEIELQSGFKIDADIVILSIGVRPEVSLLKDTSIELASNGGIKVNEYFETSEDNIYAVGDAIAFENPLSGKTMNTYLAGPANKQARMLADNLVNPKSKKYKGAIGTAIAKVFDLTVASSGLAEKHLIAEGIDYKSTVIHGGSHAGYYPGALSSTLKICFKPKTGELLGAQIVGFDGVDKRIDIIATAMNFGATIFDLQEIEHAYAPPFSSAKDIVNQAGFTAENIITGRTKIKAWSEYLNVDLKKNFLLDVRTPAEFELGHIKGAVNIEVDSLRNNIDKIPSDKNIMIYCGVGLRGYIASRILVQKGFENTYNLSGGYKLFMAASVEQSNKGLFSEKRNEKLMTIKSNLQNMIKPIEINACGLQCPGPVLKLKEEIAKINVGDRIIQKASDQGFLKDVESWCNMTGNKLISVGSEKGIVTAEIEKALKVDDVVLASSANNKTMVVFSDDMDKALASLVIANGAASTGSKVTLFFTFWGLNIIKKQNKPKVKKDSMGKMFGKMMAGDATKLKLSKMNMMGMGSLMMKRRMNSKKVDSIEQMLQSAIDQGVEMIACQMSMDVMGVAAEELNEHVTIGGVATYLEEAEKSNVNLFI